jgi:general stress protein YciG
MMGKRGGKIASSRRDMKALGKKGGIAVKAKYGPDFYKELGKKGGAAVRAKLGENAKEFYREMGRKGGASLRDNAVPGYFEEIGARGGRKAKELIEAGRCEGGKCDLKKGSIEEGIRYEEARESRRGRG